MICDAKSSSDSIKESCYFRQCYWETDLRIQLYLCVSTFHLGTRNLEAVEHDGCIHDSAFLYLSEQDSSREKHV